MGGFNYWMHLRLLDLENLLTRTYLDEGGGVIAYDSSKGNHNGTLVGPSWIAGYLGRALSFDGVDDYVTFGTSQDIAPTREFSVELLINPRRLANEWVAGRHWRNPWAFQLLNLVPRLWINDTLGIQHIATSTFTLIPNIWQYLLIVYDPDNSFAHFQVNSSQESIAFGNWNSQTGGVFPTYLGSNPVLPLAQPFQGYLDHFSLYSRVIAPSEGLDRYDRIRRA